MLLDRKGIEREGKKEDSIWRRKMKEDEKSRECSSISSGSGSGSSFYVHPRMHAAKWDTYVCCISSLWQPLTYFLPRVLPYNSGANITTYGRKSEDGKGWPGRRKGRERERK